MKPLLTLFCLLSLAVLSVRVLAIDSEPEFKDPAKQARYEHLIHEFRCLVCQDETIADSNADLAANFRRQVHAMVASGKSDEEIRSYMVNRYGDFILYKPPVQESTWFLWFGPFLFLFIGAGIAFGVIRRRNKMMQRSAEEGGTRQ